MTRHRTLSRTRLRKTITITILGSIIIHMKMKHLTAKPTMIVRCALRQPESIGLVVQRQLPFVATFSHWRALRLPLTYPLEAHSLRI